MKKFAVSVAAVALAFGLAGGPSDTGAKKPPNGGKDQPVAVKCVDCKRPPNG
jgi:hypothetical protein